MTHISSHSRIQSVSAAVLTFVVTATAGYGAGSSYISSPSGETLSALLAAPVAHSARSSTSSKKRTQRKVIRALITKPRTRTSTGSSAVASKSSVSRVPIKAGCGDALIIVPLGEECDDGNTLSGDGCSAACKVEAGFGCAGTPTTCYAHCRDGIVTPVEQCDDGNDVNGDGCSLACKKEPGFTCNGSPSTCEVTPYCGDGIKASTEQCDDGNTASGDGCYNCKTQ